MTDRLAMSNKTSTGTEIARIIDTSVPSHSKGELIRVFQNDYAHEIWGYDRKAGHKVINELTEDEGPVLIYVHGVFTDSIIESDEAKCMASVCGLRPYVSFESREKPWKGISTLSPCFYDNAMGIYYTRTAHEVFSLLWCIVQARCATSSPPVVVAHSRGALLLVKAAVLWEGLAAVANNENEAEYDHIWQQIPGFISIWKKLSDDDKKILLNEKKIISDTSIISITQCPAVPNRDSAWLSLKKWTSDKSWNFHTSKDWFLIFTRNPARGYIPALEDHNIPFHLHHNSFTESSMVRKIIASLWKHGRILGEALDMLIEHHVGRSKLVTETPGVKEK